MRANDALSGFVIIVLALAMIALTYGFPPFPGQKYGPSLFPRILGTGLIICGAMLIVRGAAAHRAGGHWIELAPWVREPWRCGAFVLTLSAILIYIAASEFVGFIPVAILFLGAMFAWLGVRPLTAVIASAAATIAIHWFFGALLRVPLPRGLLTNIL